MAVREKQQIGATVLSAPAMPSLWSVPWRFCRRKPVGALGGLLVAALALVAILAPYLAPYDPAIQFDDHILEPASAQFLLGTDNFGRDVLSRIIWGARTSLYVGLVAVTLGTASGSLLGLISGYSGGRTDFLLQRFMDMLMAYPTLILAITIVAMLGPSTTNVIIALSISLMPRSNRVVRGSVLSEKENAYIEAARVIGCGYWRSLLRHVLPNVVAPIIIIASITLGLAILVEASLSFLGLGAPPPTATWGQMLSREGRRYFEVSPGLAVFPGLAITLAVLGFNLFGDGLRDVLDPRLRGGTKA